MDENYTPRVSRADPGAMGPCLYCQGSLGAGWVQTMLAADTSGHWHEFAVHLSCFRELMRLRQARKNVSGAS